MTIPDPHADPHSPANWLQSLLRLCIEAKASDLHLAVGEPPFLRNQGVLVRVEGMRPITTDQMRTLVAVLTEKIGLDGIDQRGAVDGALSGHAGGRFRFNVFRRQNEFSVAIRRLEDRIKPLEELGLPTSLYSLADLHDGLVIVAGPTGSGKSTTLATLIDRINRTRQCHIITVEDPIEYLHPSQMSLVNQRQLGMDCPTFNDALVASLRQDPDVILVGEIRDLATIRTAITASETGHLVFTTVHASDSVGVIERITSVFPAEEQTGIRRQLSLVLRTVISQQLMIADGSAVAADVRNGESKVARRVVCSEIMHVTPAVANLVAVGKSQQIYSAIESNAAVGMQTRDQDLARLLHRGMISERSAMAYANNPTIVQDRLMRLRQRGTIPSATATGGLRR